MKEITFEAIIEKAFELKKQSFMNIYEEPNIIVINSEMMKIVELKLEKHLHTGYIYDKDIKKRIPKNTPTLLGMMIFVDNSIKTIDDIKTYLIVEGKKWKDIT